MGRADQQIQQIQQIQLRIPGIVIKQTASS
jgi:hypothetical protein